MPQCPVQHSEALRRPNNRAPGAKKNERQSSAKRFSGRAAHQNTLKSNAGAVRAWTAHPI
jgi:hypothetical protein